MPNNNYTGRVDHCVDALGLLCPIPVALMAEAARQVGAGRVIELLVDDPAIELDLPAWCHQTGHLLLGEQRPERRETHGARGQWRYWIKVAGSV